MKKFRFISLCLASAVMACALTACSDDDDKNEGGKPSNPDNVFEQGVPSQVAGLAVTTNSKGQVTLINAGTDKYTFNYDPVTYKGKKYDMTISEVSSRAQETTTFYLQLNKNGFVSYCCQVTPEYDGDDVEEWWFTYNSDKQLNYMKRSEGDNEVTDITYTNGDITKVTIKSDEDPYADVTTIEYTTDEYPEPTLNKGGVMLFDMTFDIDMDEMEVAYYAGLLGMPTKHLPLRMLDEEGIYEYFNWTFNNNGLPVSMTATHYEHGNPDSQTVTFVW